MPQSSWQEGHCLACPSPFYPLPWGETWPWVLLVEGEDPMLTPGGRDRAPVTLGGGRGTCTCLDRKRYGPCALLVKGEDLVPSLARREEAWGSYWQIEGTLHSSLLGVTRFRVHVAEKGDPCPLQQRKTRPQALLVEKGNPVPAPVGKDQALCPFGQMRGTLSYPRGKRRGPRPIRKREETL